MGSLSASHPECKTQYYSYPPLESYRDLDKDPDQIRVFTLLPGMFGDCIDGRLDIISRQNAPYYDALSYVWGDPSQKHTISISGQMLGVSQNLNIALQYLRYIDEPRTLWIDAICIDQTNLNERSSQVRIMAQIYQFAGCVLLWLGEADASSEVAFDVVERIDAILTKRDEGSYVRSVSLKKMTRIIY
jgi:hypothetical protein